MAKFVYKMQNILNLKEKIESQEKIAFAEATRAYNDEQEKLQNLFMRQAGYENALRELMDNTSIDVAEITHMRSAITTIKQMIRDQMFVLQRAQAVMEQARRRMEEATKERKMHEKLREHAFEDFKKELIAEDNKAIDQLVSFTYSPNR
ncbi:MAG: flagellar export protein FliJ [Lachnospiraceae bacterium]|nr:flagellar export protein FliJ [Lachnospiraceae bacterium]